MQLADDKHGFSLYSGAKRITQPIENLGVYVSLDLS